MNTQAEIAPFKQWTQQVLAFPAIIDPPDFAPFLGTRHPELLHTLNRPNEPFLYIWGARGTGKRHLLRLWAQRAEHQGCNCIHIDARTQSLDEQSEQADCLAIGAVEHLNPQSQEHLFNAFNRIRQTGHGALLVTAENPPAALQLREDLRTRMGYCLTYRLEALDDTEKIAALQSVAHKLQLYIETEHFHWLMQHWRRDTGSLLSLLYALNQHAVAKQRRLTLPLIKAFLQQQDKP